MHDILGNGKKCITIYRFLKKYLTKMMIMIYRFVVSRISISLVKSVIRIRNKVFVLCIDLLFEIWINWKWSGLGNMQMANVFLSIVSSATLLITMFCLSWFSYNLDLVLPSWRASGHGIIHMLYLLSWNWQGLF